ncbi:uncharacterized protein LOC113335210 [Papaver somniferum]|uniref:uncharacterized protein LOC113335210 n=1 Tax=Papaver somniferum TaxID=3469 RepID=UPI000E700BF5|nr:uncharacterized protein LOC113335210 [Papaver somniferum]
MWKYVDGTAKRPNTADTTTKEKDKEPAGESLETWEINNHRILTWIGNTVTTSISMQLIRFETSKEAWDFLSKRYTQINFAQRYKLEQDIRSRKQHHDQSISDFHSEMSVIWNQLALMGPNWTIDVELWEKYREESRLVQLLMALRDEFETVRASILHRSPLPTVETALFELITEETKKRIKSDIPTVLAVPSRTSFNNHFSSQKYHRDTTQPVCFNCKKPGHIAKNCTLPPNAVTSNVSQGSTSQPHCNYCKEPGHTD